MMSVIPTPSYPTLKHRKSDTYRRHFHLRSLDPFYGPMYVDSQFRGVANDDILTDEQLLRNSERAASVEDLEATIKFEWDALERQNFLVALASAPIGSSKEEARKKLTAQIKFAEEIGWQDVVIKDEAAVDEARGGNTSLEARFWEFATPSKYATPAKRPASSTSPGMQRGKRQRLDTESLSQPPDQALSTSSQPLGQALSTSSPTGKQGGHKGDQAVLTEPQGQDGQYPQTGLGIGTNGTGRVGALGNLPVAPSHFAL